MEGEHQLTIADLRKIKILSDLPDEVIQWLLDHGRYVRYAENDVIVKSGQPIDDMSFILKGSYIFYIESQGRVISTVIFKSGEKLTEVSGLLPYSRMKVSPGTAFAGEETIALAIHKKHFHEMEMFSQELIDRLVDLLKERIRYFTSLDNQLDKMSALGKLSAGLAHELNNPSAAIVRNAKVLKNNINELPKQLSELIKSKINPETIKSILNEVMLKKKSENHRSLMQKQKAEDEFTDWLENNNITDSWMISETLAETDLSIDDIKKISALTIDGQLEPTLKFIANFINMQNMIDETCNASEHISRLVTAVKSFSHMDRGSSKQYIDLLPGIQNTLTILNHKIKKKNIEVNLNASDKIPKINALEGELNQVWSNLIDNAIDAIEKDGKIDINISTDQHFIYVEVKDNGKGIPHEIQKNIFDPFFTTKPIGEGTGIGLDMASRIINRHEGLINVSSQPGETIFTIKLPIHSLNKSSENETANHISS